MKPGEHLKFIAADNSPAASEILKDALLSAMADKNQHGFAVMAKQGQVGIIAAHPFQVFPPEIARQIVEALKRTIEEAEKFKSPS